MKKVGVGKVKEDAIKKVVASEKSKSAKMKELFDLGMSVKEISEVLNVRYNFVYNVVSNYVNVNEIKVETNKREGKKEKIVALYKEGKSYKEISIELKTNYNYVYNVIKEYKLENENNDQAANN